MTPEEIMTQFANEHSYETWGELMHDTHEHSQIEYTKQVMIIYAEQKVKNHSHKPTLLDSVCSYCGKVLIKTISGQTRCACRYEK